jgi:hypothetical protein
MLIWLQAPGLKNQLEPLIVPSVSNLLFKNLSIWFDATAAVEPQKGKRQSSFGTRVRHKTNPRRQMIAAFTRSSMKDSPSKAKRQTRMAQPTKMATYSPRENTRPCSTYPPMMMALATASNVASASTITMRMARSICLF